MYAWCGENFAVYGEAVGNYGGYFQGSNIACYAHATSGNIGFETPDRMKADDGFYGPGTGLTGTGSTFTAGNATTVGGESPSAFQDVNSNLTTLATLNGGSLTNLTAANIPQYNGFEEITSEANIVLNPTKNMMYCTLTNAATLSMHASAKRDIYTFYVLGTNTLSLNVSHMIIKGTFTQNATNIITILPEPIGTNWVVGVVN